MLYMHELPDKVNYSIDITKPHFRTLQLSYSDEKGKVVVYLEKSAVPEYDWIGDEPSFNLNPVRLKIVLKNIYEWFSKNDLIIKIWKKEEL